MDENYHSKSDDSYIEDNIRITLSYYNPYNRIIITEKPRIYYCAMSLIKESLIQKYKNIELKVIKLLHNIGFASDLIGYECYKQGIYEALIRSKKNKKRNMTEIYKAISEKLKVSKYVEKDMRYAISKYWKYNSKEKLDNILGYEFNYKKDLPTTSELISAIIEYIRKN